MKTSQSQFEMLVTYMEQHGDLSKLSCNARDRITCLKNWQELAALLNSHGNTKTTEKWKKAWSDFKNNTKKKAARLHRASGTDGPAVFAKFSDLERRVLNLMGLQVATGLAVEEAELSKKVHILASSNNDDEQDAFTHHQFEESSDSQNASSAQSPSPPAVLRAISSPPLMFVEVESSGTSRLSISPAHSPPEVRPTMAVSHITLVEPEVEETDLLSPTRPSTRVRGGRTTHRGSRTRGSSRRRATPAHTEQAAQHFLQADSLYRKFLKQQHIDNIELRREQNRIRELEVQVQRDWQAIGERVVNVLEKVADKYCKD